MAGKPSIYVIIILIVRRTMKIFLKVIEQKDNIFKRLFTPLHLFTPFRLGRGFPLKNIIFFVK